MPARKTFVRHDVKTREKIQCTQLINRLMDHINGKIELTQSQVRSIEILLKKSLPDLQSIEQIVSGELTVSDAKHISDGELADIIARHRSEGAATEANGEGKPPHIH